MAAYLSPASQPDHEGNPQPPATEHDRSPSDADCILSAAELLVSRLESGKAIDAKVMREAMEDAFGASDADGAWIWKDAYEATEIAQILMLTRYGKAMLGSAGSDYEFQAMVGKLAALIPPQTRRSDDMIALQQFSTPLPYTAITAQATAITGSDVVLEPSAGTGMLAVFAKLANAKLHFNEISDLRRELLVFSPVI